MTATVSEVLDLQWFAPDTGRGGGGGGGRVLFEICCDWLYENSSSAGNPWVTATWVNFATANYCQVFGKRKRRWNAQAQKAGQQSCMDRVESTRRRSSGLWLDSFCPDHSRFVLRMQSARMQSACKGNVHRDIRWALDCCSSKRLCYSFCQLQQLRFASKSVEVE